MRFFICSIVLFTLFVGFDLPSSNVGTSEAVDPETPTRRRPVKMVLIGDESKLLVANRLSGSVSIVDLDQQRVDSEWKVANSIGSMLKLTDKYFVVSDAQAGQLVLLNLDEGQLNVVQRIDTIGSPGELFFAADQNRLFVAGHWSRQVTSHRWDVEAKQIEGQLQDAVDVSFAVGQLVSFDSGKHLLATDAFGSQWSVLDAGSLQVVRRGDLGTRRLCGVASYSNSSSDVQQLVVASQPVNRLAQAIRNDVHWGLMVGNELIIKDENWFLDEQWKESRRSKIPLGGAGEAKGDPESISFSSQGDVAIAIGGLNEVAVGSISERSFAYVPTGHRPVDSLFSSDGNTLYVANQLGDSVSVVDVRDAELLKTIELGKMPPLTDRDHGERMFFDATVSHDSWMSCHSCHVDGHTSGFLNDNFSDQSFGAPKRIL